MGGLISVGVLYGMKHPIHGCGKATIPIYSTALHNLLLDALLMSGVFNMGIGSIVASVIMLSIAGAEMGAVVSALGGELAIRWNSRLNCIVRRGSELQDFVNRLDPPT